MFHLEPVIAQTAKSELDTKSSLKATWLSNIISVVKSPSKHSSENKTPKVGRKCPEQAVDETAPEHRDSSQRNRRESRIALRVERRMPRSSSLDTVSTCLSQESMKNPCHAVRTMNMV